MAFSLFERWSPEYALNKAFEEMQASGLDGLKKHLTANALKTVQSFEAISGFTSALTGGSTVSFLLDKLSECAWSIRDVMKGSETSKAIVGFNYQDKLVGSIELTMIKEDKIWKIDSLSPPKFDKCALTQENTGHTAES